MSPILQSCLALALLVPVSSAAAFPFTFDDPVTLSPTAGPGVWYVDRYAPAGFVSPVVLLGDNRLKQTIAVADGAANRPPAFAPAFYNTQGRKYDLPAATTFASIDLYVPSDWASTGRRMAGFWATAMNTTDPLPPNTEIGVSFYPILEFTSLDGTPRFRAWNGGGWTDLGLPTGFAYDSFTTLAFHLSGSDLVYTVGDLTTSVGSNGSIRFANTILQGYNTTNGVDYDIFWDNLSITKPGDAVPEPGTLMMLIAGFGLVGAVLRRRTARQSA